MNRDDRDPQDAPLLILCSHRITGLLRALNREICTFISVDPAPFTNRRHVLVSRYRGRVGGQMIQNLAAISIVVMVILRGRSLCLTHCLPICPSA